MLSYPIWYLISNPNKKTGKKINFEEEEKMMELMAVTMRWFTHQNYTHTKRDDFQSVIGFHFPVLLIISTMHTHN